MFKSEAYLPLGARKGKLTLALLDQFEIFKNLQKPSKILKNLQSGFKNLQIWFFQCDCSWIVVESSEFWLRSILSSWRGPTMFSAWVDRSAEKRVLLFFARMFDRKISDVCAWVFFLCILCVLKTKWTMRLPSAFFWVFKLGPKTIHHLLSGLQKKCN